MVDIYHLFKLGTTTAKMLKASRGTYNAIMIFKSIRKPLAVMGVMGFVDGVMDDVSDAIVEKITKETK